MIVAQLPPYTQVMHPVYRFAANFNNPTVNKYDFTNGNNTRINLLPVKGDMLYLFYKRSFSGSMDEGVFLEAINQVAGVPTTKFHITVPSQTNRVITRGKIALANYEDNADTFYFAYTERDDTLQITFEGILDQPIELIGKATIYTQLQFSVYEIRNVDWINNFLAETKDGKASNLL